MSYYRTGRASVTLSVSFQKRDRNGEWALGAHTRGLGLGFELGLIGFSFSFGWPDAWVYGPGISYFPKSRSFALYLSPRLYREFP